MTPNVVNETKFKLVKMEGTYLCSNKQKRKDWDSYESVWIDRYTGVAEITNRIIAYKGTVNSKTKPGMFVKKEKQKNFNLQTKGLNSYLKNTNHTTSSKILNRCSAAMLTFAF